MTQPIDPAEAINQGAALQRTGNLAGAESLYWQVLHQDPAHFDALHLLGVCKCQQRQPAQGAWFIRRALAARPREATAHLNLATALADLGRPTEAADSARAALALRPGLPAAVALLIRIGRSRQDAGDRAGALACYRAARDGAPGDPLPCWLAAAAALPDVPADEAAAASSRTAFAAGLDAVERCYAADPTGQLNRLEHAWPFLLAYQAQDNRALMARYGGLRSRLMAEWSAEQALPPMAPNRSGPVRVGIVSDHLHNHSVWLAITRSWFALFDPARFALHAFQLTPRSDEETAFARQRAASFTQGPMTTGAWARTILAAGPEVLIYPAIGLDQVSANLAALRLAPVQLASWGHPETTGLAELDAYLSAEAFEPEGADAAYTEALIALPGIGTCHLPPQGPAVAPDLGALGLDADRPLVLCPGSPFKYAPGDDGVLVAIARGAPDAQFVFFGYRAQPALSERLQARLSARFAQEGLAPEGRLRFLPFLPMADFQGLAARADVCLDAIGFSGFNTAMQVLGRGTPLVAFQGAFMRGRFASGILRAMGMDDLVATDRAGFVALAIRAVRDPAWRATLRTRIAAALPLVLGDRRPVDALQDRIEAMALRRVRRSGMAARENGREEPPGPRRGIRVKDFGWIGPHLCRIERS